MEHSQIIKRIKENFGPWSNVPEDKLSITRLSGMSNACYKVSKLDSDIEPKDLLFRKFECVVTDKKLEQLIFNANCEQGGPKNYFCNDEFRIEEFRQARPITIWEMRNPTITK
jgi:hypothetical protein